MPRLRSVFLPLGLSVCLLSGRALAGTLSAPAITQSGSGGTLTLASANNYTGGATLGRGTLTSNGSNAYTGSTVVFNGTTFTLVGGSGSTLPTAQATAPAYSQIIVFGDSLSDTGNVAAAVDDKIGIRFPGPTLGNFDSAFDYTDGRFTNGTDTNPASKQYKGVWHEQLAKLFLGLQAANPSLDGGTDYAYGDAETGDGFRPITEGTGNARVTVDVANLNKQASTYLADHPDADPSALYIVWAGSNDLLDTDNPVTPAIAASNETAVVQRLAEAGATTFLLPNVPPLGLVPEHAGDAALTQAAADFRDLYNADLDALQATLAAEGKTVTFYRLDIFDLYTRLVASGGAAYGFTNIIDPSQGKGVKPDQFLSWDGLHPTTYGHYQIAAEAFTLLTGIPVVEVSQLDKHVDRNGSGPSAFLLTRTGADLSAELTVPYTVSGSAAAGKDYTALKDRKKIKAGKRTVQIKVQPIPASSNADSVKVKLTIGEGEGYVLPVVPTGTINLDSGGN